MRKHFLRTLVVMLIACLGVGVLAACGGLKDKDPEADPIEGVWSGATGNMEGATLTIDVDGNTAHMVQKTGSGEHVYYNYAMFAKAADGGYSFTQEGQGTLTLKVNEENKLDYSVTPSADAPATITAQSFTFETKATLPAAADITGTKYATVANTDAEITFGSAPAIKYGEDTLTSVKLIDVGGYKVFTAKYDEDDVTVIAFKDGTANKAFVSLTRTVYDLSDTEPTPPPTGDTYTVTFALGEHAAADATAPAPLTATQANQYKVTLPNAPAAAADWEFAGWQVGVGGAVEQAGTQITVNDNITVTATWRSTSTVTPETYTVTYAVGDHAASGVNAPAAATANEDNDYTVTLPAALTAAKGYTFAGWQVGGQTKQAETPITVNASTTVTATYSPITYTVKFDVTKPQGATADVVGAHDNAQITITNNTVTFPTGITLEGYTLSGWKIGTGNPITTATYTVTADDLPANDAAHEITFTAQWTKTYTVTFDVGNGGTTTDETSFTEKAAGASVTVPTVTAKKGYTFTAWKIGSKTVDGTYTVAAEDATSGTITITAEYTAISYTVKYSAGAGVADVTMPSDGTISFDAPLTLPTDPSRPGYTFDGWTATGITTPVKKTNGTLTLTENMIPASGTEITLTATWTVKTYTLRFNLGSGGSSTGDGVLTKQATGTEVDLPVVTAFKGYEFKGWKIQDKTTTLAADATKYTVSPSDAVSITEADSEITFIAQYDYIEYTVKFVVTKPDGVTAEVQGDHADATVTVQDRFSKTVTFPSVTLEGYVVTGWKLSTDPDGEARKGATYEVKDADLPDNNAAHEITFTAQWGEPDYTGVWTDYIINGYKDGSDKYDLYFEITIQSDQADGFDVVWKEYYTDDDFTDHATYVFGNFKKEGDAYKMTADGITYTFKINANYQLVLGKTYTEGDPFSATLKGDHDPLPAVAITEPAPGKWYVRYNLNAYTEIQYTFAKEGNDTIKISASGSEIVISYKAVGSYLVISGSGVDTHALYKAGVLYYTTLANNGEVDGQLTNQEPPLKVEDADITFKFDSGAILDAANMPEITETHRVGQSFNLPSNTPTAKTGSRTFLWWETASGEHIKAGESYTVKADDAIAVRDSMNYTEIKGYTITFTAFWTLDYTVKYVSMQGTTVDTSVECGTDTKTYKTNEEIPIIADEPTKADYEFQGWKLYVYHSNDKSYAIVSSVKDITYRYNTDNNSYTPNNTEDNTATETVALVFVAQWKGEEEPTTDINGVWTSGENSVTIIRDGEGTALHVVAKIVDDYGTSYEYYVLTEQEGSFVGTNSSTMKVTFTFAESELTVAVQYGGTTTYTRTSSDVPQPLDIEGTYTAGDQWTSVTINFTDKTVADEDEATFEVIGNYIVIITKGDAEMTLIVYKDSERVLMHTGQGEDIELTPKTTPQEPADTNPNNYVGVWTQSDGKSTVTIELIEGTLCAVVYTPSTSCEYYKLTQNAGGFSGKSMMGSATFSLIGSTLTVTIGGNMGATTAEYTSKAQVPDEDITLEGIYSFGDGEHSAIVDFDSNTFDMGVGTEGLQSFTVGNVGAYLILTIYHEDAPEGYEETNIVVYKVGGKYYISGTGTAPMELTPLTFSATGYTGDTPLYFYGGGLQKGEILTFRGDLQFTRTAAEGGAFAPAVADGILGYLSQGNYLDAETTTKEYIIFRLDNYFNNTAADKGKAQPAAGEFGDGNNNQGALAELNWSLIKHTIGLTAGSNDWFAAFCAMIAQANTTFKYELEYDYSTAGVVFISYVITTPTEFTYTYGNPSAQATVPANAQFIVRYAVTPSAGGNLDDLVIAIGGEQAVLTNISISKVEAPHIHKGTDICEICGKTLEKSQVKDLTLTDNVAGADAWAQHIEDQTTGDYTATANTELHVTGEFGTVGAGYAGFAIVLMETTTKQGLFLQYSSGSCRNSNWKTWVGSPWNLEKRTANGGFANLDQIDAATKSNHKFELVLVYDGTYAKLTIITYADDNGAVADTRTVTYNITGDALAIGIGFDGDGGNTQNVKNVQYYTITATDDAE